ncbi:hypothetical protein [Azospirillum sp. TSO5]|uniref:hypothetical protein n=1 Tax=Azospirillum sp. TSO5 TaxID=716760 RepID=UPI000D65C06A|nr:hypothetical protein [Azospirillum sp. TSO5]
MAYGPKICACCGRDDAIEEHHLYLRSDGCPDDLTVWLCSPCHGRVHQFPSKRVDISSAIKRSRVKARAQGKYVGGKLPFGYRVGGDGALVEDKEEQEILAMMHTLRSEGKVLRFIQKAAEDRGRKLSLGAIHRIVNDPIPISSRSRSSIIRRHSQGQSPDHIHRMLKSMYGEDVPMEAIKSVIEAVSGTG